MPHPQKFRVTDEKENVERTHKFEFEWQKNTLVKQNQMKEDFRGFLRNFCS